MRMRPSPQASTTWAGLPAIMKSLKGPITASCARRSVLRKVLPVGRTTRAQLDWSHLALRDRQFQRTPRAACEISLFITYVFWSASRLWAAALKASCLHVPLVHFQNRRSDQVEDGQELVAAALAVVSPCPSAYGPPDTVRNRTCLLPSPAPPASWWWTTRRT